MVTRVSSDCGHGVQTNMGRGRTGLPVGTPKNASPCSRPPCCSSWPGLALPHSANPSLVCPLLPEGSQPLPTSVSLQCTPHRALGGVYPPVVDPPSPGSPAALEPLHRGHWVIVLWLTGPPFSCSTCSLAVGQTGHVSSYPWDFAQAVPSGTLILTSPTSGSCPSNIHQSRLCGEATSQVPQRWLPEPIP